MEITKEKIYELGKEKIVTDLVNEILSNDPLDNTIVTEVILDDNGYCIHITFSGGVKRLSYWRGSSEPHFSSHNFTSNHT